MVDAEKGKWKKREKNLKWKLMPQVDELQLDITIR